MFHLFSVPIERLVPTSHLANCKAGNSRSWLRLQGCYMFKIRVLVHPGPNKLLHLTFDSLLGLATPSHRIDSNAGEHRR